MAVMLANNHNNKQYDHYIDIYTSYMIPCPPNEPIESHNEASCSYPANYQMEHSQKENLRRNSIVN